MSASGRAGRPIPTRGNASMQNFNLLISPLLQPPLNQLFAPRIPPVFLPPTISIPSSGRQVCRATSCASLVSSLSVDGNTKSSLDANLTERADRHSMIEQWKVEKNDWSTDRSSLEHCVFVGRLPFGISSSVLEQVFSRFGRVLSVKIIKDQNGKSRGYAFVEFAHMRDVQRAFEEADGLRLCDEGLAQYDQHHQSSSRSRRIVVDWVRGRLDDSFVPRRLGGGLGYTRLGSDRVNQRGSGRDSRRQSSTLSSSSNTAKRHRSDRRY